MMGNKLRRIFFPTEEERAEDFQKVKEVMRKAVEEKSCSVCTHFYDYSTGVSTNYGCELGDDYNNCAISRIGRGECDRWEESKDVEKEYGEQESE